jgi:hypothetical protein
MEIHDHSLKGEKEMIPGKEIVGKQEQVQRGCREVMILSSTCCIGA